MCNLRHIQSVESELSGKKVLLRVDFDVPVNEGYIDEAFRIVKQKKTIQYLLEYGAQVLMVAHISSAPSFKELIPQLSELTGQQIEFLPTLEDVQKFLVSDTKLGLLENVRSFEGEMDDSADLAKQLAQGFDLYVNNAFAVLHRAQASVHAIASVLPSYAGQLVQQEVDALQKVIDAPAVGKVIIMGGAKASTKVPVIKNFIDKADHILVGGVIANDILKARGVDVKQSLVDDDVAQLLVGFDFKSPKVVVPTDFVEDGNKYLDIGSVSIEQFKTIISQASLIIWNGPMGMFEDARFMTGTKAIAEAILASQAQHVIGGGDTITAVDQLGLLDKFNFVSSGGGAMLAFLSGESLPGLEPLQL